MEPEKTNLSLNVPKLTDFGVQAILSPIYNKDPEVRFTYSNLQTTSSLSTKTTELLRQNEDAVTTSFDAYIGRLSSPRICRPSPRYKEQQNDGIPQSPHEDVKSAALALTSLSLSPANISDDVMPRKPYQPPHNTPTDENIFCHPHPLFRTPAVDFAATANSSSHLEDINRDIGSPPLSPNFRYRAYSQNMPFVEPFKSRSYSTNRDCFEETGHQLFDGVSKQRSYSFDAFGRSHKYYEGANQPPNMEVYSPSLATSIDEGLGTSEGGSADSLEAANASKRKISHRATGFRCMWRGCDKELPTLAAIILHVRHAHIGAARAGEEEFYFDDIKSSRFSSTSSNEEELPEVESSSKTIESKDDPIFAHSLHEPYKFNIGPEHGVDQKRSKAVSVIQSALPTIPPTTVVRPRGQLQFPGYDISSVDFNRRHLTELSGINSDKKQRRRKYSGKKKCRKVYGMSNKDLWCTQCRWKKACVRFL